MLKRTLGVGFAVIATLASAQTAPGGLLPGLWAEKFTMQITKINGQSVANAPEVDSDTSCYTARDVADPKRLLLAGAEQECSISDFSMNDGKISMSVSCAFTSGPTMNGDLHGTYTPTSFDLHGMMNSHDANPAEVTASMSARRTGICKK